MRTLLLVCCLCLTSFAQDPVKKGSVKLTDAKIRSGKHLYREAPEGKLYLHAFYPPDWKASDRRPGMVFFFGGGWKNGSYTQFVPQAEYFASRGLVTLCADYRIASKHKTTPDRAIEDARAAMRWVRTHAGTLGIDPDKIIASGGSAGGHLAACTALLRGFDAPGDDTSVSCRPVALVLYNPALDLTGVEIRNQAGKSISRDISPGLYLDRSTPPTLLLFGTEDRMLPQGDALVGKARELGVRAELYTAQKMPHGFFNRPPWLQETTRKVDEFLTDLGYLAGDPAVKVPEGTRLQRSPGNKK